MRRFCTLAKIVIVMMVMLLANVTYAERIWNPMYLVPIKNNDLMKELYADNLFLNRHDYVTRCKEKTTYENSAYWRDIDFNSIKFEIKRPSHDEFVLKARVRLSPRDTIYNKELSDDDSIAVIQDITVRFFGQTDISDDTLTITASSGKRLLYYEHKKDGVIESAYEQNAEVVVNKTTFVDLKTGKNIFVNNAEYCEKVMGKGDYMRIVIMSLRGLFYDYKMVQDLKYKGKARGNKIMADIYYKNHEAEIKQLYPWLWTK